MTQKGLSAFFAVIIAIVAAWFAIVYQQTQQRWQQESEANTLISGINNTALFMTTGLHGLSNVHFATIQSLLENHPHIQVHFTVASDDALRSNDVFSGVEAKLRRIASFARTANPSAQDVVVHRIAGPSWIDALNKNTDIAFETLITPPGYVGVAHFARQMEQAVAPWTKEEYLRVYQSARELIDEVDPAIVVLDTLFMPGIDATREARRLYAYITPNTLVDTFVFEQPWLGMLWKYPIMGTDFVFPVPWRNIPENALSAFTFIWSMLNWSDLKAKQKFLREHGIRDPLNIYKLHKPHVPWLTQTTKGASIPVEVIPPNVTCTGPIVLSAAPAAQQDAELAAWLARGRGKTLLINLGSTVSRYAPEQASTMAAAIRATLEKHTDAQVLWKVGNAAERGAELEQLSDLMASDRVRIPGWLKVDPVSMLETGHIVASVHHGGSNCYHEAVYAGVPQVILPLWTDLYNFAALVETIGIGIYASRGTAPNWTVKGLTDAFIAVIDDEKAAGMRERAQKLGQKAKEKPGRAVAAAEIAKWVGTERAGPSPIQG